MAEFECQIMSDLHLETPEARPSYEDFEIQPQCNRLALLGDIGNVSDPRLSNLLDRQLQQFEVVLYVLGNHEPYGMTVADAKASLRAFEADIEKRRQFPNSTIGQFLFMDRKRYEWSEHIVVLGCTLFSCIRPRQENSVARFVSDFSNIDDWTIECHNAAHQEDLQWLNAEVSLSMRTEPARSIVILTHHSPTVLEAANDPRHLRDDAQVHSAFATDLSGQVCWAYSQVRLWSFGHTHFNCDLVDPQTGKTIVANQKGYRKAELLSFDSTKVVTIRPNTQPRTLKEAVGKASTKRKRCIVS